MIGSLCIGYNASESVLYTLKLLKCLKLRPRAAVSCNSPVLLLQYCSCFLCVSWVQFRCILSSGALPVTSYDEEMGKLISTRVVQYIRSQSLPFLNFKIY